MRSSDLDSVYCLAEKGNNDEVVRIRFGIEEDSHGKRKKKSDVYAKSFFAEPIWDWNTKLIAMEPDPEDSNQLFVLDEEKRIIVL